MKTQLAASLLLITFPIMMVSCVSSLLKEAPPTFSKDIKWTEPMTPFKKMNTSIYPTWKNKSTGNVISIVSDCGDLAADQNLGSFHQLIEGSVEKFKLVKEQKILFKNKSALIHHSQGELDGQPIEIQAMSFKRKNCGYVTSLTGKKGNLDPDRRAYNQFNESLNFE
ncbi:MAG: hypothetical protein H7061_05770 [Bdellovibrionaceae bacterium]|nr:hypothetical protein [Bdellovibrio sp.]